MAIKSITIIPPNDSDYQPEVLDKDLTTPPTPTAGLRYIVPSGSSGDWSTNADKIAIGNGSGWDYITPTEGMICWIVDEDKYYKYITSWTELVSAGASVTRGTFTNANLSSGKLTVTHSKALSAPYSLVCLVFDQNGKTILPDEITGATNTFEIDLTSYGSITGTWGYAYLA